MSLDSVPDPASITAPTGVADPVAALPSVDVLQVRTMLDPDERARLEAIEAHLQRHVRRQTLDAWNEERLTTELLPGLADLGLGQVLTDGSSKLFQGLAHAAVARIDLSLSALLGIHNELIVGTVDALGSEEQKRRWLPRLGSLESLGAFCLTEPEHGSDVAGGLATTATPDEDGWVIRGSKRWIGNGTVADIALTWARDTTDGQIKCFLVETEDPRYRAEKISGKMGLRIMQNADITFDAVRVPSSALLPGATSFAAAKELLKDSRAWVGWQAAGAQQGLLDILRSYALARTQFGRPLAGFQLIQQSLAEIAGNLSATSALMVQVTRLQEQGDLDMLHAAMVKSTATRLARQSAGLGRDAMGGNGILTEYEMAKVVADIEAIHTYEGTYHINSLIVGRALTGVSAFV